MFIQANFFVNLEAKNYSSAVIFSFSHSSFTVLSINFWVSGNLPLTASNTAKAILSRFLSILITRTCSLIFYLSALCFKKFLKLCYTHSWNVILNIVIERWLVFKISKYSHEILWLVFKILKYCPRAPWSPACCVKYPYKLFIALLQKRVIWSLNKLLLIFFFLSSNINKVAKAILNFFIQKFHNHEKAQNATIEQK